MSILPLINEDILANDLHIETDSLTASYANQASLYNKYAVIHAQAQNQAAHYKFLYQQAEFRLDVEIRSLYAENISTDPKVKPAKLTEAQITAKIETHPDYISALKNSLAADAVLSRSSNVLEALRQRASMLEKLN